MPGGTLTAEEEHRIARSPVDCDGSGWCRWAGEILEIVFPVASEIGVFLVPGAVSDRAGGRAKHRGEAGRQAGHRNAVQLALQLVEQILDVGGEILSPFDALEYFSAGNPQAQVVIGTVIDAVSVGDDQRCVTDTERADSFEIVRYRIAAAAFRRAGRGARLASQRRACGEDHG